MDAKEEKVEEIVQAAAERAVQAVMEQVVPAVESAVSSVPQTPAEPALPAASEERETEPDYAALALAMSEARAQDAERRATEADRVAQEATQKAEALRTVLSELASKFETQQRDMADLSRRIGELESAKTGKAAQGEDEEPGGIAVLGSIANVGMSEYDNADNAGYNNPHAYEVIVSPVGEGDGSGNKIMCYIPNGMPRDEGHFLAALASGPNIGNPGSQKAPEDAPPYTQDGVWGPNSNPPDGADCSWAHFGWIEVDRIPSDGAVQQRVVYATFQIPCVPKDGDADVYGPKLVGIAAARPSEFKEIVKESWKARDPECGELSRIVPIALVANGLVTQLSMTPFFDPPKECCDEESSSSPSSSSPSSSSPSQTHPANPCGCPTGSVPGFGGMRISNNVLQFATIQFSLVEDAETGCCKWSEGEKEWTDLINFKDCEA